VLIQTINPDHYAVRMAAAQDYTAFYEKELAFRRAMSIRPSRRWRTCWSAAKKKNWHCA